MSQMVLNRWLSGEESTISAQMVDQALDELEGETELLKSLVKRRSIGMPTQDSLCVSHS
jgi:hypothetical protein